MRRIRSVPAAAAVALLVLGAACAGDAEGAAGGGEGGDGDRPVVAVSFAVLADVVASVAGDRAEVWSIVPAGGDPHTHTASLRDLDRLGRSDLLVTMGANLERLTEPGAFRRAAADAEVEQLVVADHVDLITADQVIDHGDHVHDLRGGDPHVWLDPQRLAQALPAIAGALSAADPEGADAYRRGAAAYAAELTAVGEAMAGCLATIPADHRRLVVLHDAYTYFADRFGFEVAAVALPSSDAELSAADVEDLVAVVEDLDVPAVFREPQLRSTALDAVAELAGVEVGVLLTDAFTEDVRTYLDLLRANAEELSHHLGGDC